MAIAKRHHYVPQAYLQRWEDDEKLLWIYDLGDATIRHRNKDSVLWGKHLYSLTLREFSLLTTEQKLFFVAPLKEYRVFLDGNELSLPDIAQNLFYYDRFVIRKKDGSFIKQRHKAALLDDILRGKHPFIEAKYGEVETHWPQTADFFDRYRDMVIANRITFPGPNIVMNHCKNLLEFVLATYTRNPYNIMRSIKRFEVQEGVDVEAATCRRVFEEIQLKYLSGEQKMFDMDEYNIHCIFAAPDYHFLTSDNPVCIRPIEIENLNFLGIFWMPISPYTLISLSKKSDDELLNRTLQISHYLIKGKSIETFNKHICENAANMVVSSQRIEDPRFKFCHN